MAADAWTEMGGNSASDYASRTVGKLIDDRLGLLSDLGPQLDTIARDAARRLNALRGVGELSTMTARPELVRAVKQSLHKAGLDPAATGRVYASSDESGKPTWFQRFMGELNDSALGIDGWGPAGSYSLPAFYTEIAKAL
ncbi:hypothetical protein [Bradyrhizobium sp. UNPA324]|uniref:hypothetical protein n=1 Tax=Bradyrhizobium sp. UNPA324 TaxID=1141174 RepID=UPI0011514039|nr:hypothetical protein [Bradyrhizobium sp. UNPA324]TQF28780.1 hypothetical protein UNPA324_03275 [Bradyrhizobium sp. UNPA324]